MHDDSLFSSWWNVECGSNSTAHKYNIIMNLKLEPPTASGIRVYNTLLLQ